MASYHIEWGKYILTLRKSETPGHLSHPAHKSFISVWMRSYCHHKKHKNFLDHINELQNLLTKKEARACMPAHGIFKFLGQPKL